jgi:hypothetical protein
MTGVYGSELTSAAFYPNISGWAYLTSVVQHPYEETDQAQGNLEANPSFKGLGAYLGYWAFPAKAIHKKTLAFNAVPVPLTQAAKSAVASSNTLTACGPASPPPKARRPPPKRRSPPPKRRSPPPKRG